MSKILVIEPSATLRHALTRLLTARNCETVVVETYADGLEMLKHTAARDQADAVVLGFPMHAHPHADQLLSLLNGPGRRKLPVLVLVHSADPVMFNWVARRNQTALLLWDDYSDCVGSLDKLLQKGRTESREGEEETGEDIRVLFVDDSQTVRVSYSRLMRESGYVVETASCKDDAMTAARKNSFDIAIVDYFMPGGNGDELCRELREDEKTQGITTAIITGTYLDEVIKDSLGAGAVECMFKNEANELFLARLAAMSRSIRINKSISAERQRLASILGSVGDGVYGVSTDGQITFLNPAAKEILGYIDDDALIGRSAHRIFHYAYEDGRPNSAETCMLQKAYAAGDVLKDTRSVFWHSSGKPIPVEYTVFPLRIKDRLEGSVVAFRDVSERRLLERELIWQANHDPLTKLHNRHYFERRLKNEVSRLQRSVEKSALLYIDLDRFKYINDTAGHAAGDKLLVEISFHLNSRLRGSDLLARLGGDEFAIILRNVSDDNVMQAAEGFREILENHEFVYEGKTYKVYGSIGVALIGSHTKSPSEVLVNADIACHIAKNRGRNQTHLYVPENDEHMAMKMELGWSARLQDALTDGNFVLYYQPIIPVDDIRVTPTDNDYGHFWDKMQAESSGGQLHYEVLVRLADRDGEIIPPNAFLATAERFGFMPQIDAWVVKHAVAKLAEMQKAGYDVTFSVNLSGQTLDPEYLKQVMKPLFAEYEWDPRSLIFEITETSAVANIEAAKKMINELRALGFRFALDDFGSGFSSFYHLKHLPVDFIKIDGHFVQGMASDATDRAIVTSINDIAHSFGKRTIAEFVENPEILNMLRDLGVDFAQGFFISSPQAELPVDRSVAEHRIKQST